MSRNDAGARHSRARESGVNKSRRRSTSEPNLSTAVEKSGPWNKGRKLRPITQKARADFLDGLAKGLTVRLAAERAGRAHTRRFYELRNEDEEFAAAWTEAVEQGTQLLEDELRQRAVDGWDEWSTSLIASSKGNTSDSRTRRCARANAVHRWLRDENTGQPPGDTLHRRHRARRRRRSAVSPVTAARVAGSRR